MNDRGNIVRLVGLGVTLLCVAGGVGQDGKRTPVAPMALQPRQILELLGSKGSKGVTAAQRVSYRRIFSRLDTNDDGRLSKVEFIDEGLYLTKRARAGIFAASDGNRDGFVSEAEYVENRIITDEAKQIVGKMDSDNDGTVSLKEFLDTSGVKDRNTARHIFRLLDTDKSGVLVTPEYLRVWGRWARAGRRRGTAARHGKSPKREFLNLPDISRFAKNRSDRFVVDLNTVRTGHPYKGTRAKQPHTGAHVYFQIPDKPIAPRDVTGFPAVYAVADGYVSRVDEYFKLRPIFNRRLGKRMSNRRYGVTLAIARKNGATVNFHYSIEPMTDPGDPDFYKRFILVKRGQRVKKGDVIARMYIPPERDIARNTHIHFNLVDTGRRQFMAPTIFTDRIG